MRLLRVLARPLVLAAVWFVELVQHDRGDLPEARLGEHPARQHALGGDAQPRPGATDVLEALKPLSTSK